MWPDKKESGKKIFGYLVMVIGVVTAIFLIYKIYKNKDKLVSYSALSVNVLSGSANVYLDGKDIGKTQFESNKIQPGSHTVKLIGESNTYETTTTFSANSQVVINRDLGVSRSFSSGQNFWYDSKDLSSKINIVSDPSQASVFIDDVEVGKTPYSSSILSDGGYDLRIEKDGYEGQAARVNIDKSYKLNVSVQLFLRPLSKNPTLFAGSKTVYDLSSDTNDLTLDVPSWVLGLVYFNKTRSENSVKFSYILDYFGTIYDSEGKKMEGGDKITLKSGDTIAYLGRKSDNGFSTEAKGALSKFVGVDLGGKRVKVTATPTGWLRIRKEPNLNSEEIGRANTGDELFVLEEKGNWLRISTSDGKGGWVSASYVSEIK